MKNYVLPTLISLALSSSWVLAQGTPTPESATPPAVAETAKPAEAVAPASSQPVEVAKEVAKKETPPSAPPGYAEMMQKRMEHRQKMQEQMDKIHNAKDSDERQRLIDEFEQTMQQHRQEMRGMMSPPEGGYGYGRQEEDMPPPSMPPYGYGPPPGYYGGGYGPDPRFGRGQRSGPGPMSGPGPRGGFFSQHQAHQEAMEKHLQKIETLLEEIVKSLPKQQETK